MKTTLIEEFTIDMPGPPIWFLTLGGGIYLNLIEKYDLMVVTTTVRMGGILQTLNELLLWDWHNLKSKTIFHCFFFLDSFVNSYRSGFNECANEIIRYIMTMDEIDHLLKAKLLSHLANTCKLADHQPPTINCQGSTQSSSPVPSPTLSPPLLCGSTVFPSLSPVSLQDHDRTVLSSIKLETLTSGLTLLPKLPLPPQNITTIPSQSKIKQLESSRQKLWRPW